MAEYHHAQIAWCGPPPSEETCAAATAALRDVDTDAPTLGCQGYDGRWREMRLDASRVAEILDRFHPCRVRTGRYRVGHVEWDDETPEEVCKRAAWSYSRPLFRREGLDIRAQRHGSFRVVADDGTTVELNVRPGETLGFLVKDIPGAYARAAK